MTIPRPPTPRHAGCIARDKECDACVRATVAPRLPAPPVGRVSRDRAVHRPTRLRPMLRRHGSAARCRVSPSPRTLRRWRAPAHHPRVHRAQLAGRRFASPCAAAPTQPPPCSWVRRLKTPPHRTSQGSNIRSRTSARASRYSLPSSASGMAERRALLARSAPFRTGPMQRRLPVSRPRRADACRASPARASLRAGAAARPHPPPARPHLRSATRRLHHPRLREAAAVHHPTAHPPPLRFAAARRRRRGSRPGHATRPVSSRPCLNYGFRTTCCLIHLVSTCEPARASWHGLRTTRPFTSSQSSASIVPSSKRSANACSTSFTSG